MERSWWDGKLILNAEAGHLVYFFINSAAMDRQVTTYIFLYGGVSGDHAGPWLDFGAKYGAESAARGIVAG